MSSTKGIVYCFSNKYIPGMVKIGLTTRTIKERLREANGETYSPPFWICEFAKVIENVSIMEERVHRLLEEFGQRLTPKREFFTITVLQAKRIFDILPGEFYDETKQVPVTNDDMDDAVESDGQNNIQPTNTVVRKDKNLVDYIADGTQIKHSLGSISTWYATFNATKNCLINKADESTEYLSLSAFAKAHFAEVYPDRADEARKRSGWTECYAFIDEEWRSMRTLAAFG